MITLNGKQFARNDKEMANSLFNKGGTCVGYYRPNKTSITLLNLQKEKIGVINKYAVLCCYSQTTRRYSYADIKEIGEFDDCVVEDEECCKALRDNGITVIYE